MEQKNNIIVNEQEQEVAPLEKVESVAQPDNTTSPVSEQAAPKAQQPKPRRKPLTFGKVFWASLLALVAYGVIKLILWGGIFMALFSGEEIVVPERAVLKIDFAEVVVDAPSRSAMGNLDLATLSMRPTLTLFDALKAIEMASSDNRIKAIYLNVPSSAEFSITILEEMRDAIEKFKLSGKKVVAYSDSYSQWSYYLSSVADEVYVNPEGSFTWSGVSSGTLFFTGLIEKLGVEIDILRPTQCKYKSAVEPFFLKSMSAANREQTQEMVDTMWKVITESVSQSRGISVEELNVMADELSVILPSEAIEHKLIDGVMYVDQVMERLDKIVGDSDEAMISLATYSQTLVPNPDMAEAPQVAIVYANGNVVDGDGAEDAIYGEALSRQLRKVREDDSVKAVVVRVNSPGGSALASEIIWREMSLLQQQKPVVVSMGEYAASGGYYISAPADAIFANQMTLTGSIGVFGIMPHVGKALEKNLGITTDFVNSNDNSEMMQPLSPYNEDVHRAMMRSVDRVYERFATVVSEGRNLSLEQVYEIAEGRVWVGEQAEQIGLVDACGGLTAALSYAANIAGLGNEYRIVEVLEEPDGFTMLMNSLSGGVTHQLLKTIELDEAVGRLSYIKHILTNEGLYTYCPYMFDFSF